MLDTFKETIFSYTLFHFFFNVAKFITIIIICMTTMREVEFLPFMLSLHTSITLQLRGSSVYFA